MDFVFLPHHIQSPKGAEKKQEKERKAHFNNPEIPITFPELTTPNTSNEGNGKNAIIITMKKEETGKQAKRESKTKPKMNKRKRKRKAQTSKVNESLYWIGPQFLIYFLDI